MTMPTEGKLVLFLVGSAVLLLPMSDKSIGGELAEPAHNAMLGILAAFMAVVFYRLKLERDGYAQFARSSRLTALGPARRWEAPGPDRGA